MLSPWHVQKSEINIGRARMNDGRKPAHTESHEMETKWIRQWWEDRVKEDVKILTVPTEKSIEGNTDKRF